MYRELDDNEILFMVEENQNYYDILIEKYKPLIAKISSNYIKLGHKVGYELEDLIQVGNLGLMEALKYYKDNKKVLFYTYIAKCIENKIKNELRSQFTLKRKILNNYISYDEVVTNTGKNLIELIENKNAIDPYEELITRELEEKYIGFIQSLPIEIAVAYEMKNEGFTFKQIGDFLNVDKKEISRFLKYARDRVCFN